MLISEIEVLDMDYSDAPQVLRDFLIYHETICGHSKATVDQYYLDLRMFLRFLKLDRGLTPRTAELDEISIADVDISFLRTVTLTEVYSFLAYLSRDRVKQPNAHELEYGLSANSRARKIAAIRSFFKYLTVKAKLLEENPVPAAKRATGIWPCAARSRRRARRPCFSPTGARASAVIPYRSWSRKI